MASLKKTLLINFKILHGQYADLVDGIDVPSSTSLSDDKFIENINTHISDLKLACKFASLECPFQKDEILNIVGQTYDYYTVAATGDHEFSIWKNRDAPMRRRRKALVELLHFADDLKIFWPNRKKELDKYSHPDPGSKLKINDLNKIMSDPGNMPKMANLALSYWLNADGYNVSNDQCYLIDRSLNIEVEESSDTVNDPTGEQVPDPPGLAEIVPISIMLKKCTDGIISHYKLKYINL